MPDPIIELEDTASNETPTESSSKAIKIKKSQGYLFGVLEKTLKAEFIPYVKEELVKEANNLRENKKRLKGKETKLHYGERGLTIGDSLGTLLLAIIGLADNEESDKAIILLMLSLSIGVTAACILFKIWRGHYQAAFKKVDDSKQAVKAELKVFPDPESLTPVSKAELSRNVNNLQMGVSQYGLFTKRESVTIPKDPLDREELATKLSANIASCRNNMNLKDNLGSVVVTVSGTVGKALTAISKFMADDEKAKHKNSNHSTHWALVIMVIISFLVTIVSNLLKTMRSHDQAAYEQNKKSLITLRAIQDGRLVPIDSDIYEPPENEEDNEESDKKVIRR